MIEAAWVLIAMRVMDRLKRSTQRKPQALLERGQLVSGHLAAIGCKLDEQVLTELRSGIQLLIDAMQTKAAPLRREQLQLARAKFAMLTALNPEGQTTGTSGAFSNRYLNCVGYWGNFHYFVLANEAPMALRQVYLCGTAHPLLCLRIFEPEFFVPELLQQHATLAQQWHEEAQPTGMTGSAEIVQRLLEAKVAAATQAVETMRTGGRNTVNWLKAAAAGLAAGTAVSLFGIPPVVGIAAMRAVRSDFEGQVLARIQDIEQLSGRLEAVTAHRRQEQALEEQIRTLCTERLEQLTSVTPAGLARLLAAAKTAPPAA